VTVHDGAPVFDVLDLAKRREKAGHIFELRVPRFVLDRGGIVVARGRSGCGKSTLLDLLAMTLEPSESGTFRFSPAENEKPVDVAGLWRRKQEGRASRLRGRYIGYVLQTGDLLPFLSVAENILLPLRLLAETNDRLMPLAERLEIDHLLKKMPSDLSVGERQRVAIGRALVHDPAVILADEPTASVDPVTADHVFRLLLDVARERGIALVVASHDWLRLDALGLPALEHRLGHDEGCVRSEFWN